MPGLKHAGGLLVRRESLEANPASLNEKAGNFAGIGEYGLHGDVQGSDGRDSECRRKTRRACPT
jgi:hypothetical protein